ncbi:MAG: membrane protein insertion efficiency factor YidD [Candidatus Omnitrophota bacterium]
MLKKVLLSLISAYQTYIRVMLPSSCRFSPSCSDYARQAILKYGVYRGIAKAARRLFCCHPFSGKSGYDPLI